MNQLSPVRLRAGFIPASSATAAGAGTFSNQDDQITHGDLVELMPRADSRDTQGRYRIPDASYGVSRPSSCCTKPGCREWPLLQQLGPKGELLGMWAFDVCECHLRRVSEADQRPVLTAYLEGRGGQQKLGVLTARTNDTWALLADLNAEPGALQLPAPGEITVTDGQGQYSYLKAERAPFILRRYFDKNEVLALVAAWLP